MTSTAGIQPNSQHSNSRGHKAPEAPARRQLVFDTFVRLADTLARDPGLGEFPDFLVERCAQLLRADTAGLLLERAPGRDLRLAAAVPEAMRRIGGLELELGHGPCLEAYRSGRQTVLEDLEQWRDHWPEITSKLLEMGMRSGYALPLRWGDRIGALVLYRAEPGPFGDEDIALGQALADVAAIGILQQRKAAEAETLAGQLQQALESRVVIEQAKGMLAAQHGISAQEAFQAIRAYARTHRRKIHDVSQAIVDGTGPVTPRYAGERVSE
jgi:GAF domain-containing protein